MRFVLSILSCTSSSNREPFKLQIAWHWSIQERRKQQFSQEWLLEHRWKDATVYLARNHCIFRKERYSKLRLDSRVPSLITVSSNSCDWLLACETCLPFFERLASEERRKGGRKRPIKEATYWLLHAQSARWNRCDSIFPQRVILLASPATNGALSYFTRPPVFSFRYQGHKKQKRRGIKFYDVAWRSFCASLRWTRWRWVRTAIRSMKN